MTPVQSLPLSSSRCSDATERRDAESASFAQFRAAASRPLVGTLRESQISLARVGLGQEHDRLSVIFKPQDAWYVIYQLRDASAHEHWVGGRSAPAPAAPKGALHIGHLHEGRAAVLNGAFDSLNVILTRRFLDELTEDAGAAPVQDLVVPEAWTTTDPVLERLEGVIMAAIQGDTPLGPLLTDQITLAAATHLAERYGGMSRMVVRKGALAPWQERRAREMIAGNLTKEMSLADIAGECRLSLAHFSKAFKTSVGVSPHAWLQASRTARAKVMLRGSTDLAEIALTCGFADQSHFSRVFKRTTGLTPGEWRRSS